MLRLECIGREWENGREKYVEKIKESWRSVWYYLDKSIFWWIIDSYPLDLMIEEFIDNPSLPVGLSEIRCLFER